MKRLTGYVSIHPYFRIRPGQEAAFKALFPAFQAKTAGEKANLFYEFTINGDEVFCREGYADAEAALAHIANVKALLEEISKFGDLTRLEIHGPAAELAKMKQPLAGLKPAWFSLA